MLHACLFTENLTHADSEVPRASAGISHSTIPAPAPACTGGSSLQLLLTQPCLDWCCQVNEPQDGRAAARASTRAPSQIEGSTEAVATDLCVALDQPGCSSSPLLRAGVMPSTSDHNTASSCKQLPSCSCRGNLSCLPAFLA